MYGLYTSGFSRLIAPHFRQTRGASRFICLSAAKANPPGCRGEALHNKAYACGGALTRLYPKSINLYQTITAWPGP